LSTTNSWAIDGTDTRLLWQPAISKDRIAFIYAEDLWVANRDGSNPRRITASEGSESNPVFSPDGTMIAFTGQYDGNTDVFIVSATGGIPKRLTWHPGADLVRDFSPDGKKIFTAPDHEWRVGIHFASRTDQGLAPLQQVVPSHCFGRDPVTEKARNTTPQLYSDRNFSAASN